MPLLIIREDAWPNRKAPVFQEEVPWLTTVVPRGVPVRYMCLGDDITAITIPMGATITRETRPDGGLRVVISYGERNA
jgi:hypothetical protein